MKPTKTILAMLVAELNNSLDRIRTISQDIDYYNEILGSTSYLLAGLLESLLKNRFDDWNPKKWIDDSLITRVELNREKLSIWGIMIWGIEDETEQWTEPFYFEIKLNKNSKNYTEYTFLFSDSNNPEMSYEDFKRNRYYWDAHYKNDNWDPSVRDWKYIIVSKN